MTKSRELRVGAWIRSTEAAAVAGIGYGLLAFLGVWLLSRYPDIGLPEDELTAWFDNAGNRAGLIVGLNLTAVSSIAFLWFIAVVRRRIGDREDRFFATAFLGSGIAFAAIWLGAAAAFAAPAVAWGPGATVSAASVSLASGLGSGLLTLVAPRLASVFMLATANLIRSTGTMPGWLAGVSIIVAVGMLVIPIVARPVGFVFPAWVLLASLVLLIDRRAALRAEHG